MRKKWTRCALKLYWLRNAPTTTAGIPSRHGAANSTFPAFVRTHRALALLAQRVVEATSDRRHAIPASVAGYPGAVVVRCGMVYRGRKQPRKASSWRLNILLVDDHW